MPLVPDLSNPANREYWEHMEKVSKQVEKWPDWMKGGNLTECKEPKQENVVRKTSASSASKKLLK
jgi:hypothetical protein